MLAKSFLGSRKQLVLAAIRLIACRCAVCLSFSQMTRSLPAQAQVDWDGTIDERIIVRGIAASERSPFALEASAAAWVDAIDVTRVERGQPPEAR